METVVGSSQVHSSWVYSSWVNQTVHAYALYDKIDIKASIENMDKFCLMGMTNLVSAYIKSNIICAKNYVFPLSVTQTVIAFIGNLCRDTKTQQYIEELTTEHRSIRKEIDGLKSKFDLYMATPNYITDYAILQEDYQEVLTEIDEYILKNKAYKQEIFQCEMEVNSLKTENEQLSKHLVDEIQDEVKNWVDSEQELPDYIYDIFMEHDINNLDVVQMLTMDKLNDIGIVKIGHRLQILHCISKLKDGNQ
eukprot:235510_1